MRPATSRVTTIGADIAPRAAGFLVPEERALAMIESCAAQIESASTLPAIMQVITQAEAISAVIRKIKASERAKRAALALLVDAEIQLGRITQAIPHGRTGCKPAAGQRTKGKVLAEHQIAQYRASVAERLSEVPRETVGAAIGNAQRMTMREVLVGVGLRPLFRGVSMDMRKVAMNAIGLLVQCQTQGRAPRAEEVDPLRDAFSTADARHT